MSMYKQIVKLSQQGYKPAEIAKKTKAKISYIYFIRNKVKKAGKKKAKRIDWDKVKKIANDAYDKKPSKIVKAVRITKAELDALLPKPKKPRKVRITRKKLLKELQPGLDALFGLEYKKQEAPTLDLVNKPPHYTTGGVDFLDYAEAKGLTENAYLFNVVKYVSRAGKKADADPVQDLQKAEFYLKREIERRKSA